MLVHSASTSLGGEWTNRGGFAQKTPQEPWSGVRKPAQGFPPLMYIRKRRIQCLRTKSHCLLAHQTGLPRASPWRNSIVGKPALRRDAVFAFLPRSRMRS